MKKILTVLFSKEFILYVLVGGSGVVLDVALLVVFKEYLGFVPYMAVMLNQSILIAYSFFLQKYLTFSSRSIHRKEFVRYLALYGANYVVAVLFMIMFNEWLRYDYRLVRIGTIALSVSWNFFLYKYWVYKQADLCTSQEDRP